MPTGMIVNAAAFFILLFASALSSSQALSSPVKRLLPSQKSFKGYPCAQFPCDLGRNPGDIKLHAWNLLEQLGGESGKLPTHTAVEISNGRPVWEDWYTKCSELQLSVKCDPSKIVRAGVASNAIAFEGTVEQPNAGTTNQLSTIYYSPDAAEWILDNGFNTSNRLIKTLQTGPRPDLPGRQTILSPGAPGSAIVVKEIWWPINAQGGTWQLPLYDPHLIKPAAHSLGPVTNWEIPPKNSYLSIAANSDGAVDTTSPCKLPASSRFTKAIVRGTLQANCLTYRYVPGKCSDVFPESNANSTAYGLDLGRSCLIVLVGVQIMTKEGLADWSWNTYWLTDSPEGGSWAPPTIKLPREFQNFAMNTFLGSEDAPSNAPSVFNPYLEGPERGGTRSNCLGCHQRAVYVPAVPDPKSPFKGSRNGSSAEDFLGTQLEKNCTSPQRGDPVKNQCAVHTGFLWSLVTAQDSQDVDAVMVLRLKHNMFPLPVDKIATRASKPAPPPR